MSTPGGWHTERKAGHEAGGNILRYETRRVDTGGEKLVGGGRGEEGEGRVR
jgi:hypothetical protein